MKEAPEERFLLHLLAAAHCHGPTLSSRELRVQDFIHGLLTVLRTKEVEKGPSHGPHDVRVLWPHLGSESGQ